MAEKSGINRPPLADLLQDKVLESVDIGEFLAELVELTSKALSSEDTEVSCTITLLRPRKKSTVASSSRQARQLDDIQHGYDIGPCLTAAREGVEIRIDDVDHDPRFPIYLDAVKEKGIRSILAVPIPLDQKAKAALNLYATRRRAFDDDAVEQAERLAHEASRSLRLVLRITGLAESNADLKAAMESRTTIDLAVGIIMGQNRCSQEAAFKILRAASSSRNIKLRDVAAAVVNAIGGEAPAMHFED